MKVKAIRSEFDLTSIVFFDDLAQFGFILLHRGKQFVKFNPIVIMACLDLHILLSLRLLF